MPKSPAGSPERIALVTGRFAAPALREVAATVAEEGRVRPRVIELNIQVAALMSTDWVARKLTLPEGETFDRLVLPGYCRGELTPLQNKFGLPVELGPRDLYDLPHFLGSGRKLREDYGQHDLQIIAEINHAPRFERADMLTLAERYRHAGADIVDVGCDPQADREPWLGVADAVKALRDAGHRVSVDTFHPDEAAAGCAAGAELVLSVNSANAHLARDWGADVVAIPDVPATLGGLDVTLERLDRDGVRYRIDPIIEPIGFGFARSLGRYLTVRDRYPNAEIMLGIGNLSEMTGVDSAGVNMLLIGFCQELGIRSVLTTQVINWCRSAVQEIDIARRMAHYAVNRPTVPKHIDERLVMLRDARLTQHPAEFYARLAASLTDRNVRLFADHTTGQIRAMHRDAHAADADPFLVFDQLGIAEPDHAFYLGYEMAKARIALTLGKAYEQDEPLNWGLLTREETSHYDRRQPGGTGT